MFTQPFKSHLFGGSDIKHRLFGAYLEAIFRLMLGFPNKKSQAFNSFLCDWLAACDRWFPPTYTANKIICTRPAEMFHLIRGMGLGQRVFRSLRDSSSQFWLLVSTDLVSIIMPKNHSSCSSSFIPILFNKINTNHASILTLISSSLYKLYLFIQYIIYTLSISQDHPKFIPGVKLNKTVVSSRFSAQNLRQIFEVQGIGRGFLAAHGCVFHLRRWGRKVDR